MFMIGIVMSMIGIMMRLIGIMMLIIVVDDSWAAPPVQWSQGLSIAPVCHVTSQKKMLTCACENVFTR